jgi:hypothetical protein
MSFVLERTMPPSAPGEAGCHLLACGQKHDSRKVPCFVCTKDAGPTADGVAHQAKWTDERGNARACPVEQREVISQCFKHSDVVDSHDHARQALLGLEKKWATQNCWFRLDCTIVGITVTDAWKAFKIGAPHQIKTEKEMSINAFTEQVVWDCLNNKFDDDEEDNQQGHLFNNLSPMTDPKQAPHQEEDESSRNKTPRAVDMNDKDANSGTREIDLASGGSVKTSFSPLTVESATHSKWKTPVLPGKDRAARLACDTCKKLTALKRVQCNHSFCDDGSGTGGNLCFCWTKHQNLHLTLWTSVTCL